MSQPAIGFLCGICLAVGWTLGELFERRRKSRATPPSGFCKAGNHQLVPIDARVVKGEGLAFPSTVVLHRCSICGLHASPTFVGEWTIEDFLKTQSDVNWLERAVK